MPNYEPNPHPNPRVAAAIRASLAAAEYLRSLALAGRENPVAAVLTELGA